MQEAPKKGHDAILPDGSSDLSKTEQVARMFNGIAGRYDFLNHTLSLGIDRGWRKRAIQTIQPIVPQTVLDVATGTGDLALMAAQATGAQVTGIDISEGMLEVGRKKVATQQLSEQVELRSGDSAVIPFSDNAFDAVLCAYGVRNFEHLEQGLREMQRVLRPGGRLAILEFSRPKAFPVKQVFGFYFKRVLPVLGNLVSKHGRAYTYLNESAMAFPEGVDFVRILERCGFSGVKAAPLTFGVTTLYTATKS